MHPWARRLRHDIVKRAVWAARDLRSLEGPPAPADVAALRRGLYDLRDEEGAPATARSLWERMRADAPRNIPELDDFSKALEQAHKAVDALPGGFAEAILALLQIEERFEELARSLDRQT
ncbi:MAG: hypothetical protein ACJ79P_14410 [Myxococcales bacterium]